MSTTISVSAIAVSYLIIWYVNPLRQVLLTMNYWFVVETKSTKPFSVKLGVGVGTVLAMLHAPSSFTLEVDPSVVVRRSSRGHAEIILAFYIDSSRIKSEIVKLGQIIFPKGSLWIAWPKKASGVSTTVTDHVVRDIALPLRLVDNKVCAIDDVWTALRMQWRLEPRTADGPK
jgi:hypothetical protein